MADIDALYASLLAADEARDAPALAAVAWRIYGQLATTAADLGGLRARFRVYTAAPQASGRRRPASRRAWAGADLSCTDDLEVFFAGSPDEMEAAKALCRERPARAACLAGALGRREPWGVWSGQLFLRGTIVPRKRPRGRPARLTRLPSNQRETGEPMSSNQVDPGIKEDSLWSAKLIADLGFGAARTVWPACSSSSSPGANPGSYQGVRKAMVGIWQRNPRASQDEVHR